MPSDSIEQRHTHDQDQLAMRERSNRTSRGSSRARWWLLTSCLLAGALVLFASLTGAQTGSIVVEDWSKQPSGKRGIPNACHSTRW